MPTPNANTWYALQSRIDTLVTAPVMPIYEPDGAVDGEGPYILVSDVRNEPVRLGISGGREMHRFSGTLMMAIHYPISRPVSYAQLAQMAGVIAEHFPADTRMRYAGECLRVTQYPDVQQPYRDGDKRVCVVRVLWDSV